MSERLRAIRRIQAVQTVVRDLAAWKLGAAERAEAEAAAARSAMEAYIAEALPTGAFAVLTGAAARRLGAQEVVAGQTRAALSEIAVAAEGRLRLADRIGDGLAREEADAAERRRLETLVEAMLARPPQGDGTA